MRERATSDHSAPQPQTMTTAAATTTTTRTTAASTTNTTTTKTTTISPCQHTHKTNTYYKQTHVTTYPHTNIHTHTHRDTHSAVWAATAALPVGALALERKCPGQQPKHFHNASGTRQAQRKQTENDKQRETTEHNNLPTYTINPPASSKDRKGNLPWNAVRRGTIDQQHVSSQPHIMHTFERTHTQNTR